VLFDMDGTLVDSEKVWSIGLAELAAHHGGTLSPRQICTSVWQTPQACNRTRIWPGPATGRGTLVTSSGSPYPPRTAARIV